MAKYQNSADLIESCFSDTQNVGEIHAAQKGLKKVFFFFFFKSSAEIATHVAQTASSHLLP